MLKTGGFLILLALCSEGRPLSFSLERSVSRPQVPSAGQSALQPGSPRRPGAQDRPRAQGKIRENSPTSGISSALSESLSSTHPEPRHYAERTPGPQHINQSPGAHASFSFKEGPPEASHLPTFPALAPQPAPAPQPLLCPPLLEPPIRAESPWTLTHRTHLAGSLHLKMKTSFRTSYNREVQTKQKF